MSDKKNGGSSYSNERVINRMVALAIQTKSDKKNGGCSYSDERVIKRMVALAIQTNEFEFRANYKSYHHGFVSQNNHGYKLSFSKRLQLSINTDCSKVNNKK